MQRMKTVILVLVGLALLTGFTGCSRGNDNRTLVVAQGVDATTLDPGMHAETPTGNVERQIFDTLIRIDADLQYQPSVATSWEAVDDTTWAIVIRQGIKFHDGAELTAADVKYSIDRILDPANQSPQVSNLNAIKEVRLLGDYQLEIITAQPYPVLPARLAGLRVVPKHYVEQVGKDEFGQRPIGSGPYKLVSWVKDEAITLEANPDYWRGPAAIKQVVFQPIPEASSRVMALQAGQVDVAVNIPPDQVAQVDASKTAKTASVPSSRMIFIPFMNRQGPLADQRVRQALNYAVDVEGIIAGLLGGKGIPMTQTLSQMDFGYDDSLQPYGYDPERAKALLAAAGYPNGFKLTFTTPSGRYTMDKEVAEAVKSQLEAVGLQVELKPLEWGIYVDQIMTHQLDTDLWLIGWGNSLFDADGTLYSWFRSGQRFYYFDPSAGQRRQLDDLLDQARTSLDRNQRGEYYRQALNILHDATPWLMLYQQMDIYGVSERVNWTPRADEAIILYDASWR